MPVSLPYGKALTVGAVATIIARLIGFLVKRPGIDRIAARYL